MVRINSPHTAKSRCERNALLNVKLALLTLCACFLEIIFQRRGISFELLERRIDLCILKWDCYYDFRCAVEANGQSSLHLSTQWFFMDVWEQRSNLIILKLYRYLRNVRTYVCCIINTHK